VRHLRQQQAMELTVYGNSQPSAFSEVARQMRECLMTVQDGFGVQFRYEVECELRGEVGLWPVLELPPDHELRQLWIPRVDHPEPEMEPEPEPEPEPQTTPSRLVTSSVDAAAYRTCLDREFVQKELGWQEQYKRPVITVFEEEQRRQAHFDYGKAWAKYGGTPYERLLNVDSITYRRDMDEAEAMINRIVRKATTKLPSRSANCLNHPGNWDFFLSHGQAAAGDQVKMLCFLLRQRGKTVWYDNEMSNRSTAAMEEGVKHSAHFLLFLSGDPEIATVSQTSRDITPESSLIQLVPSESNTANSSHSKPEPVESSPDQLESAESSLSQPEPESTTAEQSLSQPEPVESTTAEPSRGIQAEPAEPEMQAEEGVPPAPVLPLPRDQWQRDEDATVCGNCGHAFNMYWRRHHCRHCGKLFCGNCVKARHAFSTPLGEELLKVCELCKASLLEQSGASTK
jgi:hypothetical protein